MNDIIQLIDSRINKQSRESTTLSSTPCHILDVYQNGNVKIHVFQNNSEYVVPNYSGSDLIVGEEAQLFFQGNISSGRFMYIGAAVNKQNNSNLSYVLGSTMIGEVFTQERIISQVNFRCKEQTLCLFFFNAAVLGSTSGELVIKLYIDDVVNDFISVNTLNVNEYRTISFSFPEIYSSGEHEIKIMAYGVGNITALNTYILGNQIENYDYYEPTNENEYIFEVDGNKCNVIYYIGESKCPEVPAMLEGKPVTKLYATSFNYCDVTNVYIPEGVEEIE